VDVLPKNNGPYKIYADNYYGGVELAEDLVQKGMKFTLGARANRPSFLFADGLHKNMGPHFELEEFGAWINESRTIAAVSWKDKSQVNFVSNMYANEVDIVMQKQFKEDTKSMKFVPSIAKDYTENGMGNVDSFNASLVKNEPTHKNFVWRRTHFLTLMRICLVNSWIYYQHSDPNGVREITQESFLEMLRDEIWSVDDKVKKDQVKKRKKGRNTRYRNKKRAKKEEEIAHFLSNLCEATNV